MLDILLVAPLLIPLVIAARVRHPGAAARITLLGFLLANAIVVVGLIFSVR